MAIWPLRFMTMVSPFLFAMVRMFRYFTKPWRFASTVLCSAARVAVPPMWKVRMVSWVPGSPMDWAAMTTTASPTSTRAPVARLRP